MNEWGKRQCVICKKEFEPVYASQVTCSPDCRRKRKKDRNKLASAKKWQNLKNIKTLLLEKDFIISDLKKKVEDLKNNKSEVNENESIKLQDIIKKQEDKLDLLHAEKDKLSNKIVEYQKTLQSLKSEKYNIELKSTQKDLQIKNLQDTVKKYKTLYEKQINSINTQVEEFKKNTSMLECERLHTKASKLPCGERYECWHPTKCKNAKDKAPKDTVSRDTIYE